MKISIIVPVYNAEKYLSFCVQSVLKQTYQEWELLLVDDESTDGSPGLCDGYAAQEPRIKTFHKKNGGTADARNTAIMNATGEYVTFMDNDDYWEDEKALAEMASLLEESRADVLMFDTMNYWETTGKFEKSSKHCERSKVVFQKKDQALKAILEQGLLYRAVWAKVIRRKLIQDNALYFESGIRNEDTEWTAKMLLCAESYDWYENVFYVYRKGTGVAQTDVQVTYKEVSDLQAICRKYISIGKEMSEEEAGFRTALLSYLAYPFAVWMGQAGLIKDARIHADICEMKQYAFVLNYNLDPYVNLVKKMYKICGYKVTGWILKMYFKSLRMTSGKIQQGVARPPRK